MGFDFAPPSGYDLDALRHLTIEGSNRGADTFSEIYKDSPNLINTLESLKIHGLSVNLNDEMPDVNERPLKQCTRLSSIDIHI